MGKDTQGKFAIAVKTRLLRQGKSIADLGRELSPTRPRSTVSVAIHTHKFPKVRKQVKEALGI